MRAVLYSLLFLFLSLPALAQWQSAGNVTSVSLNDSGAVVMAGRAMLQLYVMNDDLIRVRFIPSGTPAPDRSWAVLPQERRPAAPRMTNADTALTVRTRALTCVVAKKPLRLTFYDSTGTLLNRDVASKGMAWSGNEVRVWKERPLDERYYGFGEKAGALERTETHMTMWNTDIPAYDAGTDPVYQTIPFFYGVRNGRTYGIFFDNTYRSSFDMGKESRDQYSFGAEAGELNYYFFTGSPAHILQRYTGLVGRMPLPPRWSLGYQQCRWSYAPESRVREIARGFRSRNIPCDVIYLDIDYMDGYRIFTWSPKNFPNPRKMIGDLAADGFKVAVIVDPGIKVDSNYAAYRSGLAGNHFVKYPDGRLYTGSVWPGVCAFPDFTSDAARQWWGAQFPTLVNAGVRGWWNDMNEPSVFNVPTKTIDLSVIHDDGGLKTTHAKNHNIYGMEMTRATYDGVRTLLPNERPFVLTRASYAGGQRYSAAWTGDNVASWEHLRMGVSMCLNLSISGQPFVGTDIGGFIGAPSGELFARWLQMGVFSPLMRAHSVIDEKNKEPWEYGDLFTSINRETINLRYRLLPYIYTAMHEASVSGLPPMRPLAFDFPSDGRFAFYRDAFMFGDQILAAPVLYEGSIRRDLPLPAGIWYDYWTGKRFTGGETVWLDAPIEQVPMLIKAGAIIPTQQVVQYTGQAPVDPLVLTIYPADSTGRGNGTYYEDDGHTFDYERGVSFSREFTQTADHAAIRFTASAVTGAYTPPARHLLLRFLGIAAKPTRLRLGDRILQFVEGTAVDTSDHAWTFDAAGQMVTVRLAETRKEFTVTLER